jgi:exodeoxyribonuclease-3
MNPIRKLEDSRSNGTRIVSWNVNGLRSLAKNGYWESFLKGTHPDIFCLQETKASPEQLSEQFLSPTTLFGPTSGYSAFFSSCQIRKGYSGVALYSRVEPIRVINGMGIPEFDLEGRFIAAEYKDFWLLNAYFPNGGQGPIRLDYKMRFYDAFLAFAEKLRKEKPVIFCGDVNTAHEEIDLARPDANKENTGFLPDERAWIDEVISAGYIDTFRHLHPETKDAYTFWDMQTRARDRNDGWRLDYFFVSNELIKRVQKAEIHPDIFGSDHCPVSITLS